ncbi:hypothetical protein [Nonomuraea dietziae]|uniref:hypothetical protein n=1 Tax=Nonomuraea dietziae TaxID=65515 RepID=UPI0033CAE61A
MTRRWLFAAPRRMRAAALMRRWELSRADLDQAADSLGVRRMTDEVSWVGPP